MYNRIYGGHNASEPNNVMSEQWFCTVSSQWVMVYAIKHNSQAIPQRKSKDCDVCKHTYAPQTLTDVTNRWNVEVQTFTKR